MSTMRALAIGTVVANFSTIVVLGVLFVWTAASGIFGADDRRDDEDDRRWWDWDMRREQLAALKIALNLLFLAVACGTLFAPMKRAWNPSKGSCERFDLGVLAACVFMVGMMLFVSYWHTLNFERREEEGDGNDGDNDNGGDKRWRRLSSGDGNDEEEDDGVDPEELLAYHRKVVSNVSFAIALVYAAISICIYDEGRRLPETVRGADYGERVRARAEAHMEIISEVWTLLSSCTITIFSALFITACFSSRGEEGERMREEGSLNLLTVLMWALIVSTGVMLLGRKILGNKKLDGSLGVGALSGGTMYFALFLLLVFVLYANLRFDGRAREDGPGPAAATAFACLFLSLLHLAFSLATYKYQKSIMATSEPREEMYDLADCVRSSGGFKRMDDGMEPGMQMIDSREEEDDGKGRGMQMMDASGRDFQRMDDNVHAKPEIV